jgi:hypothetical protein
MFKKLWLIGLLCTCLWAVSVIQASAATCVAYYRSKCVAYTGSLNCEIGVTGLGQCNGDVVKCSADSSRWAVICGNPGTNDWCAPGVNIADFGGNLTGSYTVTPGDCDTNGRTLATATAEPTQDFLDDLSAHRACPNTNWKALNAVPCEMWLYDQQYDECDQLVSEAKFWCELPDCGPLGYDCDMRKFEKRYYDCTLESTTNYKVSKCNN